MTKCNLEGDNTNCGNCVYYPDYQWNETTGYCELNPER